MLTSKRRAEHLLRLLWVTGREAPRQGIEGSEQAVEMTGSQHLACSETIARTPAWGRDNGKVGESRRRKATRLPPG
jgi:hypothetical protein